MSTLLTAREKHVLVEALFHFARLARERAEAADQDRYFPQDAMTMFLRDATDAQALLDKLQTHTVGKLVEWRMRGEAMVYRNPTPDVLFTSEQHVLRPEDVLYLESP